MVAWLSFFSFFLQTPDKVGITLLRKFQPAVKLRESRALDSGGSVGADVASRITPGLASRTLESSNSVGVRRCGSFGAGFNSASEGSECLDGDTTVLFEREVEIEA